MSIKPQSWAKTRFAKIEKFDYFQNKNFLRTKINKSSLLVFSSCLCGHFEYTPTKFAPSNPKLYRPAHDICPKIIFGIFRSKLGKNQKKKFFGDSYHIEVYNKTNKTSKIALKMLEQKVNLFEQNNKILRKFILLREYIRN